MNCTNTCSIFQEWLFEDVFETTREGDEKKEGFFEKGVWELKRGKEGAMCESLKTPILFSRLNLIASKRSKGDTTLFCLQLNILCEVLHSLSLGIDVKFSLHCWGSEVAL